MRRSDIYRRTAFLNEPTCRDQDFPCFRSQKLARKKRGKVISPDILDYFSPISVWKRKKYRLRQTNVCDGEHVRL